jgi:hypothetical protein
VSRHRAKPELYELTGSGDQVTVMLTRDGVPIRVTAPRHIVADAMALLPRMREMLDAEPPPPKPGLRLVKGGAK